MKKPLLLFLLLVAVISAQATFVPTPGTLYNIKQYASGRVIGADGTQPCVQDVNNRPNQAFQFVAVTGLTDTYYLINEDGNYLNKLEDDSNYWTAIFESAPNGLYSEWVIVGEQDTFRLMLTQNSLYLASDNTGEGSALYVDKAADNERGKFTVAEATVVSEIFDLSEKNVRIQVEKDYQAYPITITCSGFWDDIYVTVPAGYAVSKTVFSPTEFLENGGAMPLYITSSATAGDTSTIYFAIGTGEDEIIFDSLLVGTVEKQARYFIQNNATDVMVIGQHTTEAAPALTVNVGDTLQQFILRSVNEGVNDSLFYIIQDSSYRFMRKVPSSGWNVDFGPSSEEAYWKLVPTDGVYGLINYVSASYLGADALTADSRLYDDKAWVDVATTKPYTQWLIINVDSTKVPEIFDLPGAGFVTEIEKDYRSYSIDVSTSGIKKTIFATTTDGFSVDKSSYTTTEVAALNGVIPFTINATAAAGTTGYLYFSQGTAAGETMIDTLALKSVDKYKRYAILHTSSNMVISQYPTEDIPALKTDSSIASQRYIIRLANPVLPDSLASLMDSLYFIQQDSSYRMMAKDESTAWGTVFGTPSDEAMWIIRPQGDGTCAIYNYVTGNALGTDGILENEKLWDDKTFTAAPTAAPYCEWSIIESEIGDGVKKVETSSLIATVSGKQVTLYGTKVGDQVTVYNLYGQRINQVKATSNQTALSLNSGFYLIKVNTETLKVVF